MDDGQQTRGVSFAFLFGPPRLLERNEAMDVHAKVCDATAHEDLTFKYSTSRDDAKPSAKGFEIALTRKEGRGGLRVVLDNANIGQPIRLFMSYDWPQGLDIVKKTFDEVAHAVFGALEGPGQKVMAEVRVRVQGPSPGRQDASKYLAGELLSVGDKWIGELGEPLVFAAIKLEVAATGFKDDPLEGPRRELSIERLREDPKSLYIELMSQWPQISQIPTPDGALTVDPTMIRPISGNPGDYIDETYAYLHGRLSSLRARAE